jgi:TatA/E family protein of Tat protein translocase
MFDGPFAWLMVVVALLLIFGGGKRLPEIGRGLGGFMREFKRAQKEGEEGEAPKAEPPKIDPPKEPGQPGA